MVTEIWIVFTSIPDIVGERVASDARGLGAGILMLLLIDLSCSVS